MTMTRLMIMIIPIPSTNCLLKSTPKATKASPGGTSDFASLDNFRGPRHDRVG